jgi:hypothetical protein
MTETHLSQMGSYTDRHIERVNISAKTLTARLKERNKDFEDWQKGISMLVGKVAPEALAELERLGPGYDKVVDGLVAAAQGKKGSGGQKTITDFEKEMQRQFSNTKNESLTEMDILVSGMTGKEAEIYTAGKLLADAAKKGLKIEAKPLGENAGQSLIDGLKTKLSAIYAQGKAAANQYEAGFRDGMDMHSPAKVPIALGAQAGSDLVGGFSSILGKARQAGNRISSALLSPISIPRLSMPNISMPRISTAAGGYSGGGSAQISRPVYLTIRNEGSYYVRSDADIKAIGQAQAREVSKVLRAQGVG